MSHELTPAQQQQMLQLARASIAYGLQHGQALPLTLNDYDDTLQQPGACFVTLNKHQQLRGCIGSLQAHRPLVEDISQQAYAAAFRDPRFSPLAEDELPELQLEISILSPLQAMQFDSEQHLLAQIRPHIDGLLLQDGLHKGTFLPLVWQKLPDKQRFWQQLKRKAGLPDDHWSDSLQCFKYQTQVFEDSA